MFRHYGHRCDIVDFDWNTEVPWIFVTAADDSDCPHLGGGNLHVFRPINIVTMPHDEAVKKLSDCVKYN